MNVLMAVLVVAFLAALPFAAAQLREIAQHLRSTAIDVRRIADALEQTRYPPR